MLKNNFFIAARMLATAGAPARFLKRVGKKLISATAPFFLNFARFPPPPYY